MKHYGLAWGIAQFFLLSLVAYRIQRVVTTDTWPPSMWFRQQLLNRYGDQSHTFDFFTCPWCIGSWITFAVFSLATLWLNVPLPILQAIAGAVVVGQIGQRDD